MASVLHPSVVMWKRFIVIPSETKWPLPLTILQSVRDQFGLSAPRHGLTAKVRAHGSSPWAWVLFSFGQLALHFLLTWFGVKNVWKITLLFTFNTFQDDAPDRAPSLWCILTWHTDPFGQRTRRVSCLSWASTPRQRSRRVLWFFESVTKKRFFAWPIDSVIVLGILIITSPFKFFVLLFLFPFFYAAIDFIYRTATLSMGSATFGMRIMAIELRHESGHLLDFITSVLHTIGLHVSFAFVLVQLLSIGMMVMRDDRKSLTDMVIGTFMVNRAQIRY